MLLLALGVSTAICSCSKNNEDDPIESGTSNIEAKKFIGSWVSHSLANGGGGIWTFNADGTCSYSRNFDYTGEWRYVPESKVLTTTILSWNWEIISISDDIWTGKALSGDKNTYTYERVEP